MFLCKTYFTDICSIYSFEKSFISVYIVYWGKYIIAFYQEMFSLCLFTW